jgi:hypothetical protein
LFYGGDWGGGEGRTTIIWRIERKIKRERKEMQIREMVAKMVGYTYYYDPHTI